MKNILITGGTGFIGSNLAARLVALGCNVRILRRQNSDLRAISGIDVEHRFGDVRDRQAVESAMRGCDTVFHTAAMIHSPRSRVQEQHDVNVHGTRTVVEACIANGVEKLVHTSSVAAIGFAGEGQLTTEDTELDPLAASEYGISKHLAEKEVHAGIERGLNEVIVNPSVVVGERDIHTHGGELVLSSKRGWIPFYISGGMNIVYVGDVVEGQIAAAERGRVGERYILSGENLTHKEIFERTARLLGVRPPIARLPLPLFKTGATVLRFVSEQLGMDPWISSGLTRWAGRNNWYSCEKAKRELGYSVTPFDQTIHSCYNWYREHGFI